MARKILLKMLGVTLSLSVAFLFMGCEQAVQLNWKYPSHNPHVTARQKWLMILSFLGLSRRGTRSQQEGRSLPMEVSSA